MQVYASYRHRRDLIEVLKIPGLSEAGRPLTQQEARQQASSSCHHNLLEQHAM